MGKKLLTLSIWLLLIIPWIVALKSRKHSISTEINISDIGSTPSATCYVFDLCGSGQAPIANRTASVENFLSSSVKIRTVDSIGSGTIIYFDSKSGFAYVQSCGHLWNNPTKNAEVVKNQKTHQAEILYCSNEDDVSLLRFKPDWIPNYFSLAVSNYQLSPGTQLHSTGCDGDAEPADYIVNVLYVDNDQIFTTRNSPRPGRSGGGLLSDDGSFLGVCRATSDPEGKGIGLFVSLQTVKRLNLKYGYGWLNEVNEDLLDQIPIIDHN